MVRIVEGIITGMGFIGGGAILRLKDSVKGTATAASLWTTGAMGTAVGLGSYDVAICLCLFTFVTLWMLSPLKTNLAEPPTNYLRLRRHPQADFILPITT